MGEGVFVRRLECGCRRPVGGGYVWALDTRFSVAGGVELISSRACCLVSLLESKPLRLRSLYLTNVGSIARYRIFTLG